MTVSGATPARITTVIPTYRRPRLLRRAVESALAQQGVALAVRVFDNASGDETGAVLSGIAALDQRLQYHRHESNIGGAANFEFGMRSVDTPFFSILSDDDYLLPGFYQRALEELDAEPRAMFWAGMTLNVDEAGQIWYARVDQWAREGLFTPPEGLMAIMHGLSPVWTGIVFRREIFDGIGVPDPAVLGPSDFDFILRVTARHSYILRKYPAAVLTLHGASFSSTQPISSFWPGWQKIFRNIEANSDLGPDARARALQALHQDARRMLFRRGVNALAAGRYDYSTGAAQAYESEYGKGVQPWTLRLLTALCRTCPWLQGLYTRAYRWAERRLVQSQADLQSRYGHLLQRD